MGILNIPPSWIFDIFLSVVSDDPCSKTVLLCTLHFQSCPTTRCQASISDTTVNYCQKIWANEVSLKGSLLIGSQHINMEFSFPLTCQEVPPAFFLLFCQYRASFQQHLIVPFVRVHVNKGCNPHHCISFTGSYCCEPDGSASFFFFF